MSDSTPRALLFDLGGVLVEIDFGRALKAWAPYSSRSLDELKARFRFDEQYEKHERGEIGANDYFEHIASVLELDATCQEVARGWNAIFVGEIESTRLLVESARRIVPCYAFTNTNATHMAHWSSRFPAVVGALDRIFASHEMGLRKPERAAFDYIARATALPAHSLAFFDDLAENVAAAAEAGLQAFLVRSPQDVADTLARVGIGRQ